MLHSQGWGERGNEVEKKKLEEIKEEEGTGQALSSHQGASIAVDICHVQEDVLPS